MKIMNKDIVCLLINLVGVIVSSMLAKVDYELGRYVCAMIFTTLASANATCVTFMLIILRRKR